MRSEKISEKKTIRKNKKLTNRSKRINRTRFKRSKISKVSRKNRRSFIKKRRTNKKVFGRNRSMRGGQLSDATTMVDGERASGSQEAIDAQRKLDKAWAAKRLMELKNEETKQEQLSMVQTLSEIGITTNLQNMKDSILGLTKLKLEEFISKEPMMNKEMDNEMEQELRAFWTNGQKAKGQKAKGQKA